MNTRFMANAVAMVAVALMSFATVAQDAKKADAPKYIPVAEARAKIGEVIADPVKMTELMKQLSAEDQKKFVADVNTAIAKSPGSVEEKTAKYLMVNRAALKGASKGNLANVLAVTFATVPPQSLVVLSERYAKDLFNRDADPSHKYSNQAFEAIAKDVLTKVEKETAGCDDSGVRNTLAILMFIGASNGQEGLADVLVETLPDRETRELAKKEWIPAATAEGDEKSYDAMLAYADAGAPANIEIVISLAGPQMTDAMLFDVESSMNGSGGLPTTPAMDQAFGGFDEAVVVTHNDTTGIAPGNIGGGGGAVPRTTDPDKPWNPEYNRDDPNLPTPTPTPTPEPEPEPKPYPYSNLGL